MRRSLRLTVLGYDEAAGTQTGSHNLLLGGTGNSYSSYGGIVAGALNNKISGPYMVDSAVGLVVFGGF